MRPGRGTATKITGSKDWPDAQDWMSVTPETSASSFPSDRDGHRYLWAQRIDFNPRSASAALERLRLAPLFPFHKTMSLTSTCVSSMVRTGQILFQPTVDVTCGGRRGELRGWHSCCTRPETGALPTSWSSFVKAMDLISMMAQHANIRLRFVATCAQRALQT